MKLRNTPIPIRKENHNCFCAFCKEPKTVRTKKSIGFFQVVSALILGISLSLTVFGNADWRGVLFFIGALIFIEIYMQMRWRLSIICKTCGFDPALYIKSPALASAKVTEQLDRRKTEAKYLLARPLNLPTVTEERKRELMRVEKRPSTKKILDLQL